MTLQAVPYAKLTAPKAINAREADGYKDLDDLTALIADQDLLQPLIVRAHGQDYEVVDGKRRFLAIGRLIKDGRWPATKPVPVNLRTYTDAEALETSLIANIARKRMHPVQEFEVFAQLHSKGANVAELAARYGVDAVIIKQRLALGSLSPDVRKAWRDGVIDAETAQAFAVCPDKKRQSAVLKKLQSWNRSAREVRHLLVEDKPNITDSRVRFVGLDAYKAAGGKVVESLFENDGYLEDGELLDRLTEEKIETTCAELVAAGWSWALPASKLGNEWYSWARQQPRVSYTAEEKAELKRLQDKIDEIEAREEWSDDDTEAFEDAKVVIKDAAELRGFSKKVMAETGCVIALRGTSVDITYGLVRNKSAQQLAREKEKAKAKKAGNDVADDADASPADEGAGISNALLNDITALQTTAVITALAQAPQLAVLIAAAALEPKAFNHYGLGPVRLTADGMTKYQRTFGDDDDEGNDDDEELDSFTRRVSPFETVLTSVDVKQAAARLAVNLGRALDLRQHNANADLSDSNALVAALPGAAYLAAIRETFNAEDYFKRATIQIIKAAMTEMGMSETNSSVKKAALASSAGARAKELGWLPELLRHPDYALKGAKRGK